VPSRRQPATQMTTFTLLSDVSLEDGPTKLVPLPVGESVPYWPNKLPMGEFADEEISVTGPAGSLLIYRTDILHRGSQITGERSSRFMLLADYDVWGNRWTGKTAWPNSALNDAWRDMIERASPRERQLFGFPAVGDPYWDAQTLADTQFRYPKMDISPYHP
jgi:hypothetical protein